MKFSEFDTKMRVFEEAHDHCVLPGVHMVARIDGRNFTRLTKEDLTLDRPFDEKFHEWMVEATRRVMDCGFRTVYAYTQSDEISLLLHRDESAFDRKLRKFISVLASEATAAFNHARYYYDRHSYGTFDCRISQLPSKQDVVDYFRWRQADAPRNARNAHVYWNLRADRYTGKQADKMMRQMNVAQKMEYLTTKQIYPADLPPWQWNGVGVWWETYEKEGVDPRTDEKVKVLRRRLCVDEIPTGDAYSTFIYDLLGDVS
jgi:tRNA(His) 5'-end guanylyltransferase